MPKTKIVRKNAYMRLSQAKGEQTGQVSAGSPQKGSFRQTLIPFHHLMQNDLKSQSLVSLTLRLHTVF